MSDYGDWGWQGLFRRAFEFPAGEPTAVSPDGRARVRYNATLNRLEQSLNGADYGPFTGSANVPTGRTAWVDSANGSDVTGAAGNLGTPFATIGAAIASVNALVPPPAVASPAVVLVDPGNYTESALTIAAYVTVRSTGGRTATIIAADVATQTTITGSPNAAFEGFTVRGSSGVGGIGILHSSAGFPFTVNSCFVYNCETAVRASGPGVTILATDIIVTRSAGQTMSTGLIAAAAATIMVDIVAVIGSGAATIADGVVSTGAGSTVALHNVHVEHCDDGIVAASDGVVTLHSTLVDDCANALRVEATGGSMTLTGVEVADSSSADVLIESASGVIFANACVFNASLIFVVDGATFIGTYVSSFAGDEGLAVEGELHVGDANRPAESVFGGGDSYVIGMSCKRNTNQEAGAWTDITTEMKSASGSTVDLFDAVGADNTLFVGGDLVFPGIKVSLSVALALGAGAVAVEYWNGAAWTAFLWMTTDSDAPYDQFANALFSKTTSLQMRFGTMTGWATKALDGDTKYWIRFRITAGITTIPVGEQFKLHSTRTEINKDGFVEFFGGARQQREMLFHRNLLDDQVGSAPGNYDIDVSASIELEAKDNRFANGAIDARDAMVGIPDGLDTSLPISVDVYWATPGNAGNIEWFLTRAPVKVGDVLGGALAEVDDSEVQAVSGVAHTLSKTTLSVPVSTLLAGEFLTLQVRRDATAGNANDTLADLAYLVNVRLLGWFWH